MRVALLGPPGSGKSTQGRLLAASLNIPHIATGSIIRDEIARGTHFGRAVERIIANGGFAPDEAVIALVAERVRKPDCVNGFILDGFPRDVEQGSAWENTSGSGNKLDAVIALELSEQVSMQRLSERWSRPTDGEMRRPDDEPDAIHARFVKYERCTAPLRNYYADLGKLVIVAANDDPRMIKDSIIAAINSIKKEFAEV